MIDFYALGLYLRNWIQIITCFFRTRLISNLAKDMEILIQAPAWLAISFVPR
ncbi:hypothetical protein DEHRE_10660 [Dehalobacter restrictus DSM 9455]|uniref:Uncharacterized protein n=1 Tax=Dehalobacter restrictus (strain DSM 9455 / PER-K23) TaxID=871738 RepID=A0ABN4BZ69_DEHRP|nr:hypothetical protein DEHRE_10660 [Dehalobacter restrictus DSM 9455]